MRPEESLCEGQVNEATLLGQLSFETVRSLAMYAVALATGGDWVMGGSFQREIDRECGEGFCAKVETLRQVQAERARRVA